MGTKPSDPNVNPFERGLSINAFQALNKTPQQIAAGMFNSPLVGFGGLSPLGFNFLKDQAAAKKAKDKKAKKKAAAKKKKAAAAAAAAKLAAARKAAQNRLNKLTSSRKKTFRGLAGTTKAVLGGGLEGVGFAKDFEGPSARDRSISQKDFLDTSAIRSARSNLKKVG